jgi:hypothetical protein
MTLGGLGHRIRPRQKGDKVLYVHFQSEDEMKIAQSLLHNQDFLGYTLHAKVRGYSVTKGQNVQTEYLVSWFIIIPLSCNCSGYVVTCAYDRDIILLETLRVLF